MVPTKFGGPFYRIQRAVGLIRPDHWNIGRRVAVLIAVGWLPLFLTTAFFESARPAFLLNGVPHSCADAHCDSSVVARRDFHGIALPRGLGASPSIMSARSSGFDVHGRRGRYPRARARPIPSGACGPGAPRVHTIVSYKGLVDATPRLGQQTDVGIRLTAAGWYAVGVSTPLFRFLLGLGLWNWMLWTFFASKLSRRNLKVVATHPDEHGRLGFLGLTALAFAPATFAATAVIGATWRYDLLHHGARLIDFWLPAIALADGHRGVATGAPDLFCSVLTTPRRRGILENGIPCQIQSAEFHEKWIRQRAGHEAQFLDAPKIRALNSFGQTYEGIKQLQPFPADKGSLSMPWLPQ